MEKVKIIRGKEIEANNLPASGKEAGWMKRIVYPPHVVTEGSFFGTAEVNPGYSPHRWHTHTSDKAEGYEVIYPKDFEEIYHILSGSGVVQWKTEEGKIQEEKVGPGDTLFFPVGIAEHQLFNNGTDKIVLIFCGSPTAKVSLKK